MEKITPPMIYRDRYPIRIIAFDVVLILVVALLRLLLALVGLVVVAIAIPFAKKSGPVNSFGWQMERLPWWAWPWSNDYDGIQGQKNGKNYTDHPLDSFAGKYHWTAVRNSLNNLLRYVIGFDYNNVEYIEHAGTAKDIDDGVRGWCYYRAHVKGRLIAMPNITWNRGRVFWMGWKVTASRWSDRPWCGFTLTAWRDKSTR